MLLSKQSFALLLFASFLCLASAHPSRSDPSTVQDSIQKHIIRGEALERIGFLDEAEVEFLAALAEATPEEVSQISKDLQRVREARKRVESAQIADTNKKYFQLGEQLMEQGQYDQALEAFQRAFDSATSPQSQAQAQYAIGHILDKQDSFWHSFWHKYIIEEWLKTAAYVLISLVGLYLLYKILNLFGSWCARFSNVIEVSDLDDSTDTGFGKGFPALFRTLYQERRLLPREVTLSGLAILPYRSPQVAEPVIGSPRYENFSEIKLNVAGVEVSELLYKAARLVWQPRYSLHGTIYRYGNKIHAVTTLAKYNGVVARWNFTLWDGMPGGKLARDSAYQVIDAIMKDWEGKNG